MNHPSCKIVTLESTKAINLFVFMEDNLIGQIYCVSFTAGMYNNLITFEPQSWRREPDGSLSPDSVKETPKGIGLPYSSSAARKYVYTDVNTHEQNII